MPMHEIAFPVGATNLKVTSNGVDYNLVVGTDTFARVGVDGWLDIIFPSCGGDEFVGEVLEYCVKGWNSDMDTFTAHIDTGILELSGVSDNPGVDGGYGWIDGVHPIVLMNELEVTVAMELPIDDTGAEDIRYNFYITADKIVTNPNNENDYIRIWLDVTNAGMIFYIQKNVGAVTDLVFSGSTYDDTTGRDTGTGLSTIWRIVIHDGISGSASPEDVRHMHIYLKQGATLTAAEGATENELSTSPYTLDDLLFTVGYPAYNIYTEDGTYFGTSIDSGDEAKSAYYRIKYPLEFSLKYDFADADYGKGDVGLWDGDPSVSTSQRVYDEDHVFTNDAYLQNGLLRLQVDFKPTPVQFGLKLNYWNGASWIQPITNLYFRLISDDQNLSYPVFTKIIKISYEEVIIVVRLLETNTIDDDFFTDLIITLKRGKTYMKIDFSEVFPLQEVRPIFSNFTKLRFGYVGDDDIGDDDLNIVGFNSTLSDNFLVSFDDAGTAILGLMFTNEKPDGVLKRFAADDGGDLKIEDFASVDILQAFVWIGIVPFTLVANLFAEAENEPRGTATLVTDAAASPLAGGNNAVQLNAIGDFQVPNGEYSAYTFTAGNDLPEGRYLAVIRARYVVQETMNMYVWQDFDNEYRNEENAKVTKAITATFAYYSVIFDITASDVTNTRAFAVVAEKATADTDEIRIDYHLIVPIGDGESFPQDLAHAAMRPATQLKRVYPR